MLHATQISGLLMCGLVHMLPNVGDCTDWDPCLASVSHIMHLGFSIKLLDFVLKSLKLLGSDDFTNAGP